MLGHGGSSASSYLADPTSPIPSHCTVIILFKSVPVNQLSRLALSEVCCWKSVGISDQVAKNHSILSGKYHINQCSECRILKIIVEFLSTDHSSQKISPILFLKSKRQYKQYSHSLVAVRIDEAHLRTCLYPADLNTLVLFQYRHFYRG